MTMSKHSTATASSQSCILLMMLLFTSSIFVQSLEIVPNAKPSIVHRPFETSTRRSLLINGTAAAAAALIRPTIATASENQSSSSSDPQPRPTALVTLDLSINRSATTRPLRIELFGPITTNEPNDENAEQNQIQIQTEKQNETPESISFFTNLSRGSLPALCDPKTSPPSTLETCLEYQSNKDVTYVNSQMWRLVPNRRIDFGRVDSIFSARIPPTFTPETRSSRNQWARPGSRGAVSIKRGGGAFEFTIAPVDNPALDKEELVVVGRVLKEDLGFLEELHSSPTRRDIVSLGNVPPLGGNFARACDFANPNNCAQFKPLVRVVVAASSVVVL